MTERPPSPSRRGVLADLDDLNERPVRRSATFRQRRVPFGTRVQHRATGTYGRVLRVLDQVVILELADGRELGVSRLPGGFALDGESFTLTGIEVESAEPAAAARTASGSVAADDTSARVAKPSRLWVEGDHDARLVERVWGDDLRELAFVVEPMGGIDDVVDRVARFDPRPDRRLGILVDHLVPGSKESRLIAKVNNPDVMVVGHPHVDIWQCVRPRALGIAAWPAVPRDEEWKDGVCRRLGWADPVDGWRRVLAGVNSFADLDPALVGAVESLLDFLTAE